MVNSVSLSGLLSMLLLGIQPPFAYMLNHPSRDQPNYISVFIVVGVFLLAVAGGVAARMPIVRTLQAGGNLLALLVLSFLALLVVGLTMDQFPCWIGVPNCD